MILKMTHDKFLTLVEGNEKIYKNENNSSKLTVVLECSKINHLYNPWECTTELHVVFPDDRELVYELEMPEEESPQYSASVPVTLDLTDTVQALRMYLRITRDGGAVLKTNTVTVNVNDSPDCGEEITPRAELEAELAAYEGVDEANDILESVLNGTYVPEEESEDNGENEESGGNE